VGVENNTDRNFKELEGMLGNAKALKRNNRECKGILIGPSMAPRFPGRSDSVVVFFLTALREASAQVKLRGTDGKLTTELPRKRDFKLTLPVTCLDGCEGLYHPNCLVLPFKLELIRLAA
jgi:hypothetical protein